MNIALILKVSTNTPPISGPNALPTVEGINDTLILTLFSFWCQIISYSWYSGQTNISPKVNIIIPIKNTVNCSTSYKERQDKIKIPTNI